ncbi:hypothetical protein P0D88_32125 [Paraburkholderia sp. RL18-103-BIB-C]|uniref:hypothetical protein n=1 Tax=unclassified Paraburkholderia TaxID=2615204 RepID=UPI0038BBBD94
MEDDLQKTATQEKYRQYDDASAYTVLNKHIDQRIVARTGFHARRGSHLVRYEPAQ